MLSRFAKLFATIIVLLILATLASLHAPTRAYLDPWTGQLFGEGGVEKDLHSFPYSHDGLSPGYGYSHGSGSQDPSSAAPGAGAPHVMGGVIMPKLANETAKAELGRATWKLLHTMTLRFPEHPSEDEREALASYMHLTSRLYPCGECATEFQLLLENYPPQTSSRRAASLWLCSVHNEVNARLGKLIFDCAKLDETYDCGCGDDPLSSPLASTSPQPTSRPSVERYDLMDPDWDSARDDATGVGLIKGGKR